MDSTTKLLFMLWFLKLFFPEVLIANYFPALKLIRVLPTVLLMFLFLFWFFSKIKQVDWYLCLFFFLITLVVSSFGAENTGRARLVVRLVFEYYLLAIITIHYLTEHWMKVRLVNMFLVSICYIGVWGALTFLSTGRGIISWHYILNEEDAFGPLMCIGFAVSFLMLFSRNTTLNKKLIITTVIVSSLGVVLSLARGTFLATIVVFVFSLKRTGGLFKGMIISFIFLLITLLFTTIFFDNNMFWKEMSTISEGTQSGTGRDRKVLWSIAWEEFKANPILGVGPLNFGVVAKDYLHLVEDTREYREETIWGRALHNGFFQILCEGGILGVISFVLLITDYKVKNKRSIIANTQIENCNKNISNVTMFIQSSIDIGILAFLLNAFFYDIFYYDWLYQLLIISRIFSMGKSLENLTHYNQ